MRYSGLYAKISIVHLCLWQKLQPQQWPPSSPASNSGHCWINPAKGVPQRYHSLPTSILIIVHRRLYPIISLKTVPHSPPTISSRTKKKSLKEKKTITLQNPFVSSQAHNRHRHHRRLKLLVLGKNDKLYNEIRGRGLEPQFEPLSCDLNSSWVSPPPLQPPPPPWSSLCRNTKELILFLESASTNEHLHFEPFSFSLLFIYFAPSS